MLEAVSGPAAADLARLLPALAALLGGVGRASEYNLTTALGASEVDGPGGRLVIKIPKRSRDRVEVDWISEVGDV